MKTYNPWLRALCCLVLVSGAAGCKVEFPDDVPYTCATDADCGGDNYVCAALPNGGPRYCCFVEAQELCNGLDEDCNGVIDDLSAPCYEGPEASRGVGACRDGRSVCGAGGTVQCVDAVVPSEEQCNGLDDDCDGQSDEVFDLMTDPANCGRCGNACTFLQNCVAGTCVRRAETDCGNGRDDDGDGSRDCADAEDCNARACGEGCVCRDNRQTEAACGGGNDDDNDTLVDCSDRDDCDNQSCGTGCLCVTGRQTETVCGNGLDDDGDGDGTTLIDCADPDCNRRECGNGLLCLNGACREGACGNGVDDDGVGGIDCADTASCAGESCGVGCVCSGGAATEADCTDGMSNDGDAQVDCEDTNCNLRACVAGQPDSAARCEASTCAEENCRDTLDNDGNNGADCADRTDCDYASLNQPAGNAYPILMCIGGAPQETRCDNGQDDDGDGRIDCQAGNADENCVSGECGLGCVLTNCVRRETHCADGRDNDNNNGTDCADQADCNDQSCGTGCVCRTGTRTETLCNDGADNDGNNGADCSDQADCPQGTVCRRAGGQAGTCQANRTCQ